MFYHQNLSCIHMLRLTCAKLVRNLCFDLCFACFEQRVPWHSGNYRVWIHSETRTWHDKNIQLMIYCAKILLLGIFLQNFVIKCHFDNVIVFVLNIYNSLTLHLRTLLLVTNISVNHIFHSASPAIKLLKFRQLWVTYKEVISLTW